MPADDGMVTPSNQSNESPHCADGDSLRILVPLSESRDRHACGAKAVNLGRLHQAGFPVPDGVVLSNATFQKFLASNNLCFESNRVSDYPYNHDWNEAERESDAVRRQIRACPFPNAVAAAIGNFLVTRRSASLLAVRSSAIGEDSEQAAFAGQLDSILGVRPEITAVQGAIQDCWASYWSARCLRYQQARGVRLCGMGVIIQSLVDAQFSGVMFTRNPLRHPSSHSNDTILIEYCAGTGEELVAGRTVPHRIVADRTSGAWSDEESQVTRRVSEEPMVTRRVSEEPPNNVSDGSDNRIAPAVVQQLVEAGHEIEKLMLAPQDVEWCVSKSGQLLFLQSRPVTTASSTKSAPVGVPPRPHEVGRKSAHDSTKLMGDWVVWSNANMVENYPDPVCPMLASIAVPGYAHYFRNLGTALGLARWRIDSVNDRLNRVVGVQAGRLYYNLTNIHAVLRAAPFGKSLVASFNQYIGAMETTDEARQPSWLRRVAGLIRGSLEVVRMTARSAWCVAILPRLVRAFENDVDAFASRAERAIQRRLPPEVLKCFREFQDIRNHRWVNASLADASAMVSHWLLRRLLSNCGDEADDTTRSLALLSGLNDLASTLPALDLWDLSRQIRRTAELLRIFGTESNEVILEYLSSAPSPEFDSAFQGFLQQWGHRCSGELLLTRPSFREQPTAIIDVLKAYCLMNDDAGPRDRQSRQEASRVATTNAVRDELSQRGMLRVWPFSFQYIAFGIVLRWASRSISCRERARLKQSLLYGELRKLLLTIGDVLHQREIIASPSDVFLLTAGECESLMHGDATVTDSIRHVVLTRRLEMEKWQRCRPPETIRLPVGTMWHPGETHDMPTGLHLELPPGDSPSGETYDSNSLTLRGTAAATGRATARAVVLSDIMEIGQLRPGDILVAPQTDPGWIPAFLLVSGLVVERGGLLSHSAILAREFGIPTVVGVADATRRIRTGQLITVDGDLGIVYHP